MRKYLLIGLSVLILLGLAGLGVGYWVVLSPNTGSIDEPTSLYIPRGAGLDQVVDSMETRDILGSSTTFQWMARTTGWGDQIKAGHYRIEPGLNNYDLLSTLRRGLQDPVRLTIPPGTRPEVVAAVAAREMDFPADSFLTALRDTALASELGTDTTTLFGYMLPETYHFYWLTPADEVVRKVKQQFDRFYTDQMARRADSLGLSTSGVVTLASIVEWETGLVEEKPTVAGVYVNRLERGMKLDADPTVQYGLLQTEGQKRRLLYEDYELQHPYNTYLFRGLPPGPVTNPSKTSIRAVTQAEDHPYLYFVAHEDGGHTFNRTLREHINDARRFHRAMRARRAAQDTTQ